MQKLIEKTENGVYLHNGKHINLKQIGNLVREGHSIKCINYEGVNLTHDVLFNVAFSKIINKLCFKTKEELTNIFSFFFEKETLEDIIENGGLENYIIRIKKGFIRG